MIFRLDTIINQCRACGNCTQNEYYCSECEYDLKVIETIDYYGYWGYIDHETKSKWKKNGLI